MAKRAPPQSPPVLHQDLGSLEVAEGVFRDIFKKAIQGVEGVASLSVPPSGFFRRGTASAALRIERGGGEVAFSVRLTVCYNVNIPALVADLRGRATAAVEEATGFRVRAVNVTIDHILPPESPMREQAVPEGDAESPTGDREGQAPPSEPLRRIPDVPPVPDEE